MSEVEKFTLFNDIVVKYFKNSADSNKKYKKDHDHHRKDDLIEKESESPTDGKNGLNLVPIQHNESPRSGPRAPEKPDCKPNLLMPRM